MVLQKNKSSTRAPIVILVSEPDVNLVGFSAMGDNQKFKGLEDGIQKLENQLQAMAVDNARRFEKLESNQNQFSSQLKETQETNWKLEMIISQLDAVKKADAAAQTPRSMASVAQGSLSLHDSGQSSNSSVQVTPSTTSTYPVGRGFTFPSMLPVQSSLSSPVTPFTSLPYTSMSHSTISLPPPPASLTNRNPPLLPLPNVTTPNTTPETPSKPFKAKINFPEFNGCNPRGWIRKCEQFFEIYQISENEKMSYVSVHVKEKADVWFDSHLLEKKGTNWPLFCAEVCRRFGNVRPIDIVDEFNNNKQTGSVESYQEKFDELKAYMLLCSFLV